MGNLSLCKTTPLLRKALYGPESAHCESLRELSLYRTTEQGASIKLSKLNQKLFEYGSRTDSNLRD